MRISRTTLLPPTRRAAHAGAGSLPTAALRTAVVLLTATATAATLTSGSTPASGADPTMPASPTAAEPTFNRDVAPLVFQHCAKCHRPGEVAPFSLLSFPDVAKRTELILSVVERRAMPPWKPVADHGEFANGRGLTEAEIETVRRWVAAGSPEGAAADLPPTPQFADGRHFGKPDLELSMPEATSVPADGRDVYLNVILPLEVPSGKYLKAVEFKPGNRRVVHHAVLFVDTTGEARRRDAAEPGLGFHAVSPPGRFLPGTLAIWTPGREPVALADGLSMPWPDDADLVLNLHLHPSGKPETERSSVGIYFTDEPPRRSLVDLMLIDRKIDIAPGDRAFRTHDECELPIDMEVLSIFPHMHLIGKEFRVTAKLPDGSTRSLLRIDDWDFNWQNVYEFARPVRLPQGTRLEMSNVHDNSADNPMNPRHPPERVRWGEQSYDEMSIAFVNLRPADEDDLRTIPPGADRRRMHLAIRPADAPALFGPKSPRPVPSAERIAEILRRFDRDGDDKLNLDEVHAALGKREPIEVVGRRAKPFDRDGDRRLDRDEIAAALKALAQ